MDGWFILLICWSLDDAAYGVSFFYLSVWNLFWTIYTVWRGRYIPSILWPGQLDWNKEAGSSCPRSGSMSPMCWKGWSNGTENDQAWGWTPLRLLDECGVHEKVIPKRASSELSELERWSRGWFSQGRSGVFFTAAIPLSKWYCSPNPSCV